MASHTPARRRKLSRNWAAIIAVSIWVLSIGFCMLVASTARMAPAAADPGAPPLLLSGLINCLIPLACIGIIGFVIWVHLAAVNWRPN